MPWSAQIHTGFPVPRTTWDASRVLSDFAYRTITVYGAPFQMLLLSPHNPTLRSRNPLMQASRFSLFPFRSPLLGESHVFYFPEATEMVQFAPFASLRLCGHLRMMQHDLHRVAPFGNPRIKGCLHVPEDSRSLPRPSSPSCAKASTVRPL